MDIWRLSKTNGFGDENVRKKEGIMVEVGRYLYFCLTL
jgi:hypothetical protein